MLFERAELLEKKGKRILKSLNWAIDAYCNRELSDEEFDALFKMFSSGKWLYKNRSSKFGK